MIKLNEKDIVELFVSHLIKSASKGIRDDVIIIPQKIRQSKVNLILKCDMLVESTDVPFLMQPWQIARKSVIAGISDFAAKGIQPSHCIISVGIPKSYSKNDLENLILGFQKVSKEYKVEIVGGDTNESKEIVIDCSLIFRHLHNDCPANRLGRGLHSLLLQTLSWFPHGPPCI